MKKKNRFKKWKIKIKKRNFFLKENPKELQKLNVETEVYNNNKNVTEGGKKLKSLIRFHSANKIGNYNGEEAGRKEKQKIKLKRIYRASQNMRIIHVFLQSLLSETFPSLEVTVHLTSLGCPPKLCWSLDLIWGQLRS